jgi:hypothetical protein
VPRLSDTQLVPNCQEWIEVVLFDCDVVYGDHDVDDRLGCQSWDRSGTDVFDLDVLFCESFSDTPPVIAIDACPTVVMVVQLEVEPFGTPDEFD